MDVFYPGSFVRGNNTLTDRQSELLYFSLVTLSTIGYSDMFRFTVRPSILTALGGIGVLYVAITVAILISKYQQQTPSP